MIDIPIRRENLDTPRETRDEHTQRKDHVKRQQEGEHLQAKERGLRGNQPCLYLQDSENPFLLLKQKWYFVTAAPAN